MADLRARLLDLPKEALASLLVEHGERDERLRERLLLLVTTWDVQAQQSMPFDIEDVGRAVRRAIEVQGYIDYRGAGMYARQVEEALDVIERVLASPHGEQALPVVEVAIEALSSSLNNVDDSGEINDALDQLKSLHLRACGAAKLTPQALAKKLFDAVLNDSWYFFGDARERYALLLGDDWGAEFDRLVREAWDALPMLGPNERAPERGHRRARLQGMMQGVVGNDVEGRIDVVKKDLSSPSAFERIARICIEAGQIDRAVTWVEKGLKLFPRRDAKLVELARGVYEQLGRRDDVTRLAFDDFVGQLDIASYRRMRDTCEPKTWAEWRMKAIRHVEEQLGQSLKARTKTRCPKFADGTLLVECCSPTVTRAGRARPLGSTAARSWSQRAWLPPNLSHRLARICRRIADCRNVASETPPHDFSRAISPGRDTRRRLSKRRRTVDRRARAHPVDAHTTAVRLRQA
jgi:hypothetical protein